jgi:Na+/phosphate symporter
VHSSVAAVLLFVTLAAQGIFTMAAAAMILGANLGGSLIANPDPFRLPLASRRMVVANFSIAWWRCRSGNALVTNHAGSARTPWRRHNRANPSITVLRSIWLWR